MFEWLRRRENNNDGVHIRRVLRHPHDFTTSLHSERVA